MVSKKSSSSSAAKVVAGVPMPPVRSSAAEKGTKLRRRRRNPEKKKKEIVEEEEQVGKAHAVRADDELEKQIVKLRKELDSQYAKRDALEARASEAENKLQDYTLKLENLQKINDEQKKRIRALQVAKAETPTRKLLVSAEKSTVAAKKSKKKQNAKSTPSKKLLVSSKKSAPTAKKSKKKQKSSSDDDSPSEDMTEDQDDSPSDEDTEVGDDDLSQHGLHYFQYFGPEKRLPDGSKTLYATEIYNPPYRKLKQVDFVKFFSDIGKVVKVEIQFDPKCADFVDFAKIEFESHDVAKKAMEKKQSRNFIDCGVISLNGILAKNPRYDQKDFSNERLVVNVTGFGKAILSDKLRSELTDFFSVCGVVDSVSTPVNRNSDFSKGVAFVEFKNVDSLNSALRLDGNLFLGSPLKVRRAKVFVSSM